MRCRAWKAVMVGLPFLALMWHAAPAPNPLTTALRAAGAAPSGYSLNDWVEVSPSGVWPPAVVDATVVRVGRAFGCRGPVVRSRGRDYQKWQVSCRIGSIATRVVVERLTSGGVYMVVDRAVSGGLIDLAASVRAARLALAPWGTVHAGLTLEGWRPGLLSRRATRRLVARALTAVGGREVNAMEAREWVSVSAYAPQAGPPLMVQHRPVDLEVAVVRNVARRRTEVLVGSPLIAITY